MKAIAYVDGALWPADAPALDLRDAGLRHGIGLFETMRVVGGQAEHAALHLERLLASAVALDFPATLDRQALQQAIEQAVAVFVAANAAQRQGRLRLTVTAGAANLLAEPLPAPPARCCISLEPLATPLFGSLRHGIALLDALCHAPQGDPHAGHKTLAYWWRLREYRRARSLGAQEALITDRHGCITGGTLSNLFVRCGDRLWTPPARGEPAPPGSAPPCLPGVTRALILQRAASLGLSAGVKLLHAAQLQQADEVFVCNAGFGIAPVRAYNGQPLGKAGTAGFSDRLLDLLVEA